MADSPDLFRTPRFMASALVVLSWGGLVTVSVLAGMAAFNGGLQFVLALLPAAGISLFGVLFGELCCAVFDIARALPVARSRGA
jgi:hypothetical protein